MTHSEMQMRLVSPQKCVVTLVGAITEHFDFWNLSVPVSETLDIDFDRVTSINSVGLRGFREWIHSLRNGRLQLSRVSRPIVDQINLLADLLPPHAEVTSFYVPYFTEELEEEKIFLFRKGVQYVITPSGQITFNYPDVRNSENAPMALDANPNRYFSFLTRNLKVPL